MKRKQAAYAGLMAVLMLLLGGMALPVRSASAAKVIAKGSCGEMTEESYKRGQKEYRKKHKKMEKWLLDISGWENVGHYASDAVKWKLYGNGTMVISGKGAMIGCTLEEDDDVGCRQPWEKYHKKIKKLVVKEGVTTIGMEMFSGCTALKKVCLPRSLEVVEWGAFRACRNLRKVQWEEGIKEVQREAFRGCGSLEHIRLPESVMVWGFKVFAYSGLKEIAIPEVAAEWYSESFAGCPLKEVKIPAEVKNYGDGMFRDCSSLEKVVLEEGVAFHEEGETCVFDGEEYTYVWDSGERMFEDCTALTEINLPERMPVMPAGFLKGCTALAIEKLPEGIEYLGWYPDVAQGGEAKIPETVTTIGSYCFEDMEGLEEITIPPNVRHIEYAAFAGSGLKKITVPETVTWMDTYVFSGCRQLEEADIRAGVEEIEVGFFGGCSGLRTIYLPGTLKELDLDSILSRYHVNDTLSLETLVIRSPYVESLDMGQEPIRTTIYAPAAKIGDYKEKYREYYNYYFGDEDDYEGATRQRCTWKELESLELPEQREARMAEAAALQMEKERKERLLISLGVPAAPLLVGAGVYCLKRRGM